MELTFTLKGPESVSGYKTCENEAIAKIKALGYTGFRRKFSKDGQEYSLSWSSYMGEMTFYLSYPAQWVITSKNVSVRVMQYLDLLPKCSWVYSKDSLKIGVVLSYGRSFYTVKGYVSRLRVMWPNGDVRLIRIDELNQIGRNYKIKENAK